MDFLKRLFGGSPAPSADKVGMFFYVRPKRCNEVVQVRVNLHNDLSEADEGDGYVLRKMVRATRCPFAAELHVTFDKDRRVVQVGVENGNAVEEGDYQAWLESKGQGAE